MAGRGAQPAAGAAGAAARIDVFGRHFKFELTAAEKDDLCQGKMLENAIIVRLLAASLRIGGNLSVITERDQLLDERKQAKAEAEETGDQEAVDAITVNDEGEVVAELSAPLDRPAKGFVVLGFPERPERLEALESLAGLKLDKILRLKVCDPGEEGKEAKDLVIQRESPIPGGELHPKLLPFTAAMEKYVENIAELEAVEGLGLATYEDVKTGVISQIFRVNETGQQAGQTEEPVNTGSSEGEPLPPGSTPDGP